MIKNKPLIISAFLLLLILAGIFLIWKNKTYMKRPNIIFIYADDLGWKDVGFMGSKFYDTPSLDALAAGGRVFTNAYANAPNCAPSRAALLTGLYSPRTGIFTVGTSERGKSEFRRIIPIQNKTVLDTGFITIAEAFRQNGYTSISIGKWHLGDDPESGPLEQGFDFNVGGWHLGHPKSYFSPYKNPVLSDGPEGEYLTDRLTNEALNFIEQHKNKPFFLYFPHYAVHSPLQAKENLTELFRSREPVGGQKNPVYAAMVKSLDESVGRIILKLNELNLRKRTIIIFTSDNGGVGPTTSMAPLRGSKGMLYEGGIREPFIVSWPGRIKPGTRSDYPIIGTDIFPTLLSLTRTKPFPGQQFDGLNLKKLFLKGKKPAERPLFWFFPSYLERYRGVPDIWRTTPAAAVRYGDWKLIRFFETGLTELYNLKEDIGETHELSEKFPKKKKEMENLLEKWIQKTNAPVPSDPNPEFDETAYNTKLQQIKEKNK
jgi:arylsulfatase A-like enzyme